MARESRKRRGRGEGSIFYRQDRDCWAATINIGYDQEGKRQRQTIFGKSKAEVQEKLVRLQTENLAGTLTKPLKLTVAQYMAEWLEGTAKGEVRASTYIDYESVARNHVNPAIGGVQLTKLTPIHVRSMVANLEKAGVSKRMQQKAYAVLHRALADAVKMGMLPKNVCSAATKPKVEKKSFRVLSPEEVHRFLEVAKGDRLYALYVLAIATGLRQGELFALRWEDIDLKTHRLSVTHTMQELKGEHKLGQPKTNAGRRLVLLPAFAVAIMEEHKKRMAAEGHGDTWVFCDTAGNPLRKSNVMRRSFVPLLTKAKLPRIRFHDLRHTAATLLMAQGVHPKVVQERLGHSQVNLTLDVYSHVLPSLQEEAASKLDELFRAKQD
jgi:integrase